MTEGSDIEFSHTEEPVRSWCVRNPYTRLRVLRRCRRYNRTVTLRLKTMWNTSLPTYPEPVGIENCKQLFSPLLAFTTQKIATRSTDIISAARVALFWVVNATRNEKSCLQFLISTAVFHMLLRRGETHVEHYAVRERELQWRSRRNKRDIPNVFHSALR